MVESAANTPNTLFRTARNNAWGTTASSKEALDDIAANRLVVFGEKHGNKHVIELQTNIQ